MLFVADLLGKFVDDIWIVDIAPLCGDGEEQMLTNQPGDQTTFVAIQAVELAEVERLTGTQFGVVATTPFGDVVE